MSDRRPDDQPAHDGDDTPPGALGDTSYLHRRSYLIGFALAMVLTLASFWVAGTPKGLWEPGIAVALGALAVAQMGVHLVFFFHLTSAPDNTNNALALAFGVLIVFLVIAGSLWIMANLDHNTMTMANVMAMQR